MLQLIIALSSLSVLKLPLKTSQPYMLQQLSKVPLMHSFMLMPAG